MKASKELINHLSSSLWNVPQSQIESVLNGFEGNPIGETHKHPIELVNERYPNGWYCEAFEEVFNDLMDATGCKFNISDYKYWGFNNKEIIHGNIVAGGTIIQKITKSEYLSITRPKEVQEWKPKDGELVEVSNDGKEWYSPREFLNYTSYSEFPYEVRINSCANGNYKYIRPYKAKATPPQRDWTGVRFKRKDNIEEVGVIDKEHNDYDSYNIKGFRGFSFSQQEIKEYFSNGTWIEIPNEEQPTIHADKPHDPLNLFDMEKRLKAAEDTIDVLSRDKENLWVSVKALEAATFGSKRNLDIEDWKTVECLSYEEITKIIEDKCSGLLDCTNKNDIKEFKEYIKIKLKK